MVELIVTKIVVVCLCNIFLSDGCLTVAVYLSDGLLSMVMVEDRHYSQNCFNDVFKAYLYAILEFFSFSFQVTFSLNKRRYCRRCLRFHIT